MINPSADRAMYRQVADVLRAAIQSGEYPPGRRLPSETDLCQEHGVGRTTARRALTVLRQEGLAVTIDGYGTVVTDRSDPDIVPVRPGDEITVRRANDDERRQLDLPEGAPLIVIHRAGQEDETRPADAVIVRAEP